MNLRDVRKVEQAEPTWGNEKAEEEDQGRRDRWSEGPAAGVMHRMEPAEHNEESEPGKRARGGTWRGVVRGRAVHTRLQSTWHTLSGWTLLFSLDRVRHPTLLAVSLVPSRVRARLLGPRRAAARTQSLSPSSCSSACTCTGMHMSPPQVPGPDPLCDL